MGKQASQKLSTDQQANLNQVKEQFTYPINQSLNIREIFIPSLKEIGFILYIEGTADTASIEVDILRPLLIQSEHDLPFQDEASAVGILQHILFASKTKILSTFQEIIEALLNGSTVILAGQDAQAISIDTKKFAGRQVSPPTVENTIRGPKEAFIESVDANHSLIRKQLYDQDLICEVITIGERSARNVLVLYIKDVANPKLVQNVKQRISEIQVDSILQLSILEQHIEDRSYSILPSVLLTERPDRACAFLLEGHVALLMDSSPQALIAPVTFWSLFQTGEEIYLRWPYGNFLRVIRLIALFIAIFTPALYIAISVFHAEMLPTDLMLAIAATRERVPFSSFVEVLFMEITFEILREAGVRIPMVIGPTVGIVGALILGQAAVDANIVSPILLIIVSITGLASFAMPDSSLNFIVRILRFTTLFPAVLMGFYGIALFFTFVLAYAVHFTSFGVPFLSPLSPYFRSSKDMLVRPPAWKLWLRPLNLKPQDKRRQKKWERN